MSAPPKLRFPKLRRIALRHFSLFSLRQEIDEDVQAGVFCLAGANGLGKSTFLSAANYALTGIVPNPDVEFRSVNEFPKDNHSFAQEYFSGRIIESDREAAEVYVELLLGTRLFALTRGLFDTSELRHFQVRDAEDPANIIFEGETLGPAERDAAYKKQICETVGLAKFDQFVFLQHYVMTFDERRHLLFWDPKVIEQVLFLAFGVDHKTATEADILRRDAEKADSLARNAKWQATKTKQRAEEIKSAIPDGDDEFEPDLLAQHNVVTDAADAAELRVTKLQDQLHGRSLLVAELSAKHLALRNEYAEEFTKRLRTTAHLRNHPVVVTSIGEHACAMCGDNRENVAAEIKERVESGNCPLCGCEVAASSRRSPKILARLQALDSEILTIKKTLDDTLAGRNRIQEELRDAENAKKKAQDAVSKFEKENRRLLAFLNRRPESNLDALLSSLAEAMDAHLEEQRRHVQRRDAKRREFRKLQKALTEQYAQAEDRFVPLFQELAFQFVGIDLDIRLASKVSSGATLVLTVANSERREHHQLSESQRFFIDIALRMALIQYMADAGGTLFLDTPEGSLDIAYENRAGGMLANFAAKSFDVLMTANINTSKLLLALAQQLGSERMQLCRMTSWTELSEVQVSEEHLFEGAYADIEHHMAMHKSAGKKTKKQKASGRR